MRAVTAPRISRRLAMGTDGFGFGIADGDGVSITLQALGANRADLGSAVVENLNNTADVNGNSYFTVTDAGYDIFGVKITQTVGNANYSGLAVGDIEVAPAPEPAAFFLVERPGSLWRPAPPQEERLGKYDPFIPFPIKKRG